MKKDRGGRRGAKEPIIREDFSQNQALARSALTLGYFARMWLPYHCHHTRPPI
jgi:hypothetical protein